jgi:hypothetical protein
MSISVEFHLYTFYPEYMIIFHSECWNAFMREDYLKKKPNLF